MSRKELTLNEKAATEILEAIATDANSLRAAFLEMECGGTGLEGASLSVFRVFAEKIGWMAELGLNRLSGSTLVIGDAEDWLLSPTCCDAVRAAENEHATQAQEV